MTKKKFAIRLAIKAALFPTIILAILAICNGSVIEENLKQEIAKWIICDLGLICIAETFAYILCPSLYSFRETYSKKYKFWRLGGMSDEFVYLCQRIKNYSFKENKKDWLYVGLFLLLALAIALLFEWLVR